MTEPSGEVRSCPLREPLDTQAKKQILRTVPYGLYALTTALGDEVNAFTATWVSQCSFEPPLVMVAIRKDSRSHELIRQSGIFALNLVQKCQQAMLSRLFKSVERQGPKLNDLPFHRGVTGAPIFDDALAALECEVRQFHEAGDHSVVIAEIVAAYRFKEGDPLICSDTSWHYAG